MTGGGVLVAVCGVGTQPQTAVVSRLLATDRTTRSAPGALLLTAVRGPHGAGPDRALARRAIVVADIGPLSGAAPAVLRLAAVVVCVIDAEADSGQLARALARRPPEIAPARWIAAQTGGSTTPGAVAIRIAAVLLQWIGPPCASLAEVERIDSNARQRRASWRR